jgi:hypothetical protein
VPLVSLSESEPIRVGDTKYLEVALLGLSLSRCVVMV